MDIDSGKIYNPEEIEEMDEEARRKLTWISREEYQRLIDIAEADRPKELKKMRSSDKNLRKKKRKAQRQARKKSR